MTSPLVTVITPAYNLADYLPETIESVLSQDYPHLEYIVLDDGSRDNTVDVLKHYTGRLIWESHTNMGESRTVNKGFAMANGDYVVIVNADDPLRPGMIRTLVAYMEAHPEVLAVYPDWIEIDERSQPIEEVQAWDYDYATMLSHAACVPGPGALIRRRGLEIVKGRDLQYRYVSDMEFWFRLGMHGPLARYPEPLATHRTHGTSSGVAQRPAVGEEVLKMIEEFFSRPDLPAHVRPLYKPALSAGYFEAAVRQPDYKRRQQYLRQSLKTYPRGWLEFKYRPVWVWSALLLPEIITKGVWALTHPLAYVQHKRRKATPQDRLSG
ncbi:MAG: glycosyltransferase family 2 protein [Anaerolineae bacterium]